MTLLKASDWLDFLHRGGNVAHFWCASPSPTSTWFDNNQSARLKAWRDAASVNPEQYVSINPSSRIPPHNASGNTNPKNISKQIEYIQCINVLHCEYDGKDWVRKDEYHSHLPPEYHNKETTTAQQMIMERHAQGQAFYTDPVSYKAMALAHIADLPYRPTLIVDSGGGYHCYWYLTDPMFITDSNRQQVIDTQHWFVKMNGGDQGVSDIARVYRVIGTKNMKPGWGGNNPLVQAIEYDGNRLYDYRLLSEAAGEWRRSTQPKPEAQPYTFTPTGIGTVRERFNSSVDLVGLLVAHGYRVQYRAGRLVSMIRPGGEKHSLTAYPPDGKRPAVVKAHNTADPLYKEAGGHDAYGVMMMLEHGGDWKAAHIAAKKAVGLWEETSKPRQQQRPSAPGMVAA